MKTILLLEDDDDIREVIILCLSNPKYKIVTSASVKGFREQLDKHQYDLFILDVMLPDGNGKELCKELKATERTRDIPVMLMSANFNNNTTTSNCTGCSFIAKPFEINDFVHLVQKLTA